MGKTRTKLAVYALVQLLLLHLSGLVAAATFYIRKRADACDGPAFMFKDFPPYRCAMMPDGPAGSIQAFVDDDQIIALYGEGEEGGREKCNDLILMDTGYKCAIGGPFTGVIWAPPSTPAPPPAPDAAEKGCDAQAKPTGIAYSEESTDGRWILTTDNATEMYTQMDTIPDAQKVDWLQAHGATFKPGL